MSFRGGEKTEGGATLLQKGAPSSQPFQLQKEPLCRGSYLTVIFKAKIKLG